MVPCLLRTKAPTYARRPSTNNDRSGKRGMLYIGGSAIYLIDVRRRGTLNEIVPSTEDIIIKARMGGGISRCDR